MDCDDWGNEIKSGDTVSFSYGIPPVRVVAPIVERDGELIAITAGHNPPECPLRELRQSCGSFYKEE